MNSDDGHGRPGGEPWHHRAMASGPQVSVPGIEDRWSSTVVLGDGESVLIRPIRPSDAPALAAFHERQPRESNYRRYFSPKPRLNDRELEHFTVVDFVDRAALVVERYGEFIGWASYERWPGRDDADAAFQVDDAHQGKGIATLLLEHLAAVARSNGIVRFTAEVLADNRPMLAVFARAGWPVERRFESGVVDLDFSLEDTDEFLDSVERREQRADSRAVARLLLPRTIAVVGASDVPGSIGNELWQHVTAAAKGPVYAVNPFHDAIGGQLSYARLQDVPAAVHLAVVAVPAAALATVIDDCIAARARGAVVITSIEGTEVDMDPLVTKARSFGVRLIGPGSMGVAAPRRSVGVDALLVPAGLPLPPGNVAISLQSGSLGASVLRLVEELQMGLSWFVSLGDKSDVSGNDLLQFWEDDDTTGVIAMYNESFGNVRKFARIARRVSCSRPIVAVRSGAAAIGPSGGALYQQAGLIEVPTVEAMLDTARVLATQPPMRGPRVAVLANSRSPQTLSEAALHSAGLEAVPSRRRLDWRSTPEEYGEALREALADDTVDGVMIVHAPPMADQVDAPVEAIDAAAKGASKPIVTVLMGGRNGPLRTGSAVPAFAFPEPAAGVLGRVHLYGAWLADEASIDTGDVGDIDRVGARAVITSALDRGDDMLAVGEVVEVLRSYGVTAPETRKAPAADAVALAEAIGYPVAVKAERRHLGRSLLAGVGLDLANDAEVVEAVTTMQEVLGDDAANVVVQPMVAPGLDLRIRSTLDERLGPLIAIGLGGAGADLLVDEAARLAPLTSVGATALVAGSRAGPALEEAGLPVAPVVDALIRVAQLVGDHPEIAAADLNPIVVSEGSAAVTDAIIHVRRPHPMSAPIRRLD